MCGELVVSVRGVCVEWVMELACGMSKCYWVCWGVGAGCRVLGVGCWVWGVGAGCWVWGVGAGELVLGARC